MSAVPVILRAAGGLAAALLLALVLAAAPAAAQDVDPGGGERVLSFDSKIVVDTDGDVTVTEAITVVARGGRIRRGIFRDLPVGRASGFGRTTATIDVLAVRRDGKAEPYRTESDGGDLRIVIGDPDVFLHSGIVRYEIVYRYDRQVEFYADYDEIYWNVTGNGWAFEIEEASALVVPPGGADALSTAAYTGLPGSTDHDVEVSRNGNGDPVFRTTRPLAPGEGLTVAVSWPKGVVAEPSKLERAFDELKPALLAGLGLVLVLAYYYWSWRRVGVDPAPGPVVPIYDPSLPPYAMRFLERGGYDATCLSAALLDSAVKGHVAVDETGGETRLSRTDGKRPLSAGEQAALATLFAGGEVVSLSGKGNETLARTDTALRKFLASKFLKEYLKRNYLWFAAGLVLTLAVWLAVSLVAMPAEEALVMPVAALGATLFLGWIGSEALAAWRRVSAGNLWSVPGALIASVFAIFGFVAWAGGLLVTFVISAGLAATVLLVAVAIANVVFFKLLQAPTQLGRKALDEIAGTRLYLTVAEADRLKFHNPPDRTPEHLEKLLPYAVALDVETAWTEQFKAAVAAAALPAAAAAASPAWYHGPAGGGGLADLGGLGNRFDRSIGGAVAAGAQAIAAAKARASGSGASSGGGSSGGGGGGGGGGGW